MRHMKIGFTGTRGGMTTDQSAELRRRLSSPATNWDVLAEFHHGDCVGADEEFHEMVTVLAKEYAAGQEGSEGGVMIVVHPPLVTRLRAYCGVDQHWGVKILQPKRYHMRDADIAKGVDILIAAPSRGEYDSVGSGTWLTVGMARVLGKPIVIIHPDGKVSQENWMMGKKQEEEEEEV